MERDLRHSPGRSDCLPFPVDDGCDALEEERRSSILSSSRQIESGADQRLGKGNRAETLDSVPEVMVRGKDGGIKALISCVVRSDAF